MNFNFLHNKWTVYIVIISVCIAFTLLLLNNIDKQIQIINTKQEKEIDSMQLRSAYRSDSLAKIIVLEKRVTRAQVESLAKRTNNIKATAKKQTQVLINQYEDLFKKVECFTDDSIGRIYDQKINSTNFDTLLNYRK